MERIFNSGLKRLRRTGPYYAIKSRLSDVYRSELDINPLCVVGVNPSLIKRHSPTSFSRTQKLGTVAGGQWDLMEDRSCGSSPSWSGMKIEDHLLYTSMKERYLEGIQWEETNFYQQELNKIKQKGYGWYGCRSEKMLIKKTQKIDNLYKSLKKDGYISSYERVQEMRGTYKAINWLFDDPYHEVSINIGRDGDMFFNGNGRHRLFLSKIIGIDNIQVQVIVRHKIWFEELLSHYNSDSRNNIQEHPELGYLYEKEKMK